MCWRAVSVWSAPHTVNLFNLSPLLYNATYYVLTSCVQVWAITTVAIDPSFSIATPANTRITASSACWNQHGGHGSDLEVSYDNTQMIYNYLEVHPMSDCQFLVGATTDRTISQISRPTYWRSLWRLRWTLSVCKIGGAFRSEINWHRYYERYAVTGISWKSGGVEVTFFFLPFRDKIICSWHDFITQIPTLPTHTSKSSSPVCIQTSHRW